MHGDPEVLSLLNEQLTGELTAINQYFLRSKMQHYWGFTELAAQTRRESFDEMNHAEWITDRIVILEGVPHRERPDHRGNRARGQQSGTEALTRSWSAPSRNYQRLFSVRVGETLREQFEADLAIEREARARLQPGIVMCREKQDTTSAVLLERIMADEETHIDYLETQLELMDKLGDALYAAQCVSRPPT